MVNGLCRQKFDNIYHKHSTGFRHPLLQHAGEVGAFHSESIYFYIWYRWTDSRIHPPTRTDQNFVGLWYGKLGIYWVWIDSNKSGIILTLNNAENGGCQRMSPKWLELLIWKETKIDSKESTSYLFWILLPVTIFVRIHQ